MVSQVNFVRGFVIGIVTIVTTYLLYSTFGPAYDQMGATFASTLSTFDLPDAWENIMQTVVLDKWAWFYSAGNAVVIFTLLWAASMMFRDTEYSKEY